MKVSYTGVLIWQARKVDLEGPEILPHYTALIEMCSENMDCVTVKTERPRNNSFSRTIIKITSCVIKSTMMPVLQLWTT